MQDENDVLEWAQVVDRKKLVVGYMRDVKVSSLWKNLFIKFTTTHVHFIGDRTRCVSMILIAESYYKNFRLSLAESHSKAIRNLRKSSIWLNLLHHQVNISLAEQNLILLWTVENTVNSNFIVSKSFQINFLIEGTIHRYDFATPEVAPTIYREMKLNGIDENKFALEQVFYRSYDGTKIPMFIVQKNGSSSTESKSCFLHGFGGLNRPIPPVFFVRFVLFMEVFNGILAFPGLRGGGEYGAHWYNGGRLLNRQNVFDDYQAAAEYLVRHKYTEHKNIAIESGSTGGSLIAASTNQRPEFLGRPLLGSALKTCYISINSRLDIL